MAEEHETPRERTGEQQGNPDPGSETRRDEPRLPGWGEGHGSSRPLSEYDMGERGSFGRTYRFTPRSDDEIRSAIHEVLASCEDLDEREIEVSVDHGAVDLRGTVDRPYQQRLAQRLVEDIPGVRSVGNAIRHRDPI